MIWRIQKSDERDERELVQLSLKWKVDEGPASLTYKVELGLYMSLAKRNSRYMRSPDQRGARCR